MVDLDLLRLALISSCRFMCWGALTAPWLISWLLCWEVAEEEAVSHDPLPLMGLVVAVSWGCNRTGQVVADVSESAREVLLSRQLLLLVNVVWARLKQDFVCCCCSLATSRFTCLQTLQSGAWQVIQCLRSLLMLLVLPGAPEHPSALFGASQATASLKICLALMHASDIGQQSMGRGQASAWNISRSQFAAFSVLACWAFGLLATGGIAIATAYGLSWFGNCIVPPIVGCAYAHYKYIVLGFRF
mmetsp:Transcript_23622/g.51826  ORF Transcript_23622/g.51826 Transcript_23622/m.51826 type:complete len:245 (-) Transcript_23622:24-758(-)